MSLQKIPWGKSIKTPNPASLVRSGFALVATLSLLILLTMLAVGLLSLSAVSLRSSGQGNAQAEARANARLALILALGELQKEMGPDMRVSAEAAIFDSDPTTTEIDGIAQARWLATYDSWGNWLNADYTPPGGSSINIRDTYTPKRETMFRSWLLSMPPGSETNPHAADSLNGWDHTNSVVLVGRGSLGGLAASQPVEVTRAFLTAVGKSGRHAWWIGGENLKAKVDLASKKREMASDEWAVAQGSAAQVSAGAMANMGAIHGETPRIHDMLSKAISFQTLSVPSLGLGAVATQPHFFNLTDSAKGVLASVRTGGLRKDLSLLLDRDNDELPAPYRYNEGENAEPSIRPLSDDILAVGAAVPNRPFASWPALRHYYRMYRKDSDTKLIGNTHTGGHGALLWDGEIPYTNVLSTQNFRPERSNWTGENAYMRVPIIAKLTFLHSIKTDPNPNVPGERLLRHVFSPVVTIWNPYNTEMRFPSGRLGFPASINHTWPTEGHILKDGAARPGIGSSGLGSHGVYLHSDSGADIILSPGEFKVFSYRDLFLQMRNQNPRYSLYPGFDPSAIGGNVSFEERSYPEQEIKDKRIGMRIAFHNYFGWNRQNGHTPGGLSAGLVWGEWDRYLPNLYQIDWFNMSQTLTPITADIAYFTTSEEPVLVGYTQLALKSLSRSSYETIGWEEDWRVRNWIQSPPGYFGGGIYLSENAATAHTQRLDSAYVISFGPVSALELPKVIGQDGEKSYFGSGANPYEKVTAVSILELPTAPISGLAGFSGMRMSPGWIWGGDLFPDRDGYGEGIWMRRGPRFSDNRMSMVNGQSKRVAYQSGITGPGIGNSFMHPMIPKTGIYRYQDNSRSHDQRDGVNSPVVVSDTRAYCDFWDHVLLLNDALWDDYYVSTLTDQIRPGSPNAVSLSENVERLVSGEPIANPRFLYHDSGVGADQVKQALLAEQGYLKSAAHLMIDGAFNVNSTSVQAWRALFTGIRERVIHYRRQNGSLAPVEIPSGATIALSRFDTPNSDQEVSDPALGVRRADGNDAWTGIRFLTDKHIELLAEKCVEQVKRRGPFLNFSEFINRRLSDDRLGVMGALQSAIDYDDANPDPASINHLYKKSDGLMIRASQLGTHEFSAPEAAEGSRLAGTPGYVIQSDILKPIAGTLTVRDDTFRIRTYGESLGADGKVIARAWCEALVQRFPEYQDPVNSPEVPARMQDKDGNFQDNPALSPLNRTFGRRFQIVSFRWLNASEI